MTELENLPEGWTVAKLGEICFTTSGGTPSRKVPRYYSGNIPWVKSGELDKGTISDTEEKISEEAIKNSSAKIFPVGTLLIALYGATVGKLAFLGVPAATNQAVCGIFESEILSHRLLYYFLLFHRGNLIKQSIGGAQPNISQGIIKELPFLLPPLPEQHRIVTKLEQLLTELDKGIEQLQTAQQQLKIYRQAVLKWAFEGKLSQHHRLSGLKDGTDDGSMKNKISEIQQSVQISDSDKGELPEGWEWKKIGEVVKKTSVRVLPKENPNLPFIGMDCIEPHSLKPFKTYLFGEFKSSGNKFLPNQILYGRMRPYLNKVYKAEFEGACSGEFIILQCNDDYNPDLLKYIMHHSDFVNFSNMKTAGDRPRVTFEELSDYKIPFYSLSEQSAIVQQIESASPFAIK